MIRILFLIIATIFSSALSAQKLKTVTEKYPFGDQVKTEYTVLKKQKKIKHGIYKTFFEGGQEEIVGTYDQNRKTGEWKEFNPYGELRRVRIYQLGKRISDKKHGIWKEITSDGKQRFFDYDRNEYIFPQIPNRVEYPREAREDNISGIVKIKVALDENCEQTELTVVKSLRKDCDKAALKGVNDFLEKLKFYPYDCPNHSEIITITFKLD